MKNEDVAVKLVIRAFELTGRPENDGTVPQEADKIAKIMLDRYYSVLKEIEAQQTTSGGGDELCQRAFELTLSASALIGPLRSAGFFSSFSTQCNEILHLYKNIFAGLVKDKAKPQVRFVPD